MSKEDAIMTLSNQLSNQLSNIAASLQQIEEILRDQSQPKFIDFITLNDTNYALDNRGNYYKWVNTYTDKEGDVCHQWSKIKIKLNTEY